MRSWYLVIFLFFHSLVSVAQEDAQSQLLARLEHIQSFRAQFTQKIRDVHAAPVARTRGEVLVRRPNHFYWKTQAPDAMLVVADGTYLWTYDIDLAQVTRQKLHHALRRSPAALLAGDLSLLKRDFTVSFAPRGKCIKQAQTCFWLRPVEKEASFSDVIMGFSQGKLVEIKMHDALGQEVETVFDNVVLNAAIPAQRFRFAPPAGVDIIQAEDEHD